jgi:hypothetical protein
MFTPRSREEKKERTHARQRSASHPEGGTMPLGLDEESRMSRAQDQAPPSESLGQLPEGSKDKKKGKAKMMKRTFSDDDVDSKRREETEKKRKTFIRSLSEVLIGSGKKEAKAKEKDPTAPIVVPASHSDGEAPNAEPKGKEKEDDAVSTKIRRGTGTISDLFSRRAWAEAFKGSKSSESKEPKEPKEPKKKKEKQEKGEKGEKDKESDKDKESSKSHTNLRMSHEATREDGKELHPTASIYAIWSKINLSKSFSTVVPDANSPEGSTTTTTTTTNDLPPNEEEVEEPEAPVVPVIAVQPDSSSLTNPTDNGTSNDDPKTLTVVRVGAHDDNPKELKQSPSVLFDIDDLQRELTEAAWPNEADIV